MALPPPEGGADRQGGIVTHLGGLAAHLASASMALARRMHAGATLWCVSPQWPEHAQHVAVEFVHPVIMGKRAPAGRSGDRPRPGGDAADASSRSATSSW